VNAAGVVLVIQSGLLRPHKIGLIKTM